MSLKYHIIHFIVKDIEKQLEIDQKKVSFFILWDLGYEIKHRVATSLGGDPLEAPVDCSYHYWKQKWPFWTIFCKMYFLYICD